MNCLYNVLPGKLAVIILITLINSGETDSPTHKSSSTFYNCASDVEITCCFPSHFAFLVRIYQMGWQFSCHLITGRNDRDLSPENVHLILFKYENKLKFIPKGMAVQLPPYNR